MARVRLSIAAGLALLALAGCGGNDDPPAQPTPTPAAEVPDPRGEQPAGDLTVTADPGGAPAFSPTELQTDAGRVKLELVNLSNTDHALCVESEEQGGLGCTGTFRGDRSTLRLRLEPGRYTFFCSVSGHREAGMKGTLRVN